MLSFRWCGITEIQEKKYGLPSNARLDGFKILQLSLCRTIQLDFSDFWFFYILLFTYHRLYLQRNSALQNGVVGMFLNAHKTSFVSILFFLQLSLEAYDISHQPQW